MSVFSEYQTDTIDLALDFYGYEDCPKNYEFGPSVRDNFVLHFITKGKGVFHINKKEIHLEAGDLFLLPKNMIIMHFISSLHFPATENIDIISVLFSCSHNTHHTVLISL